MIPETRVLALLLPDRDDTQHARVSTPRAASKLPLPSEAVRLFVLCTFLGGGCKDDIISKFSLSSKQHVHKECIMEGIQRRGHSVIGSRVTSDKT